ncbi:MAG: hypothetical protein HYX52_02965 [Chloroflexi bacterium]|nr:hypothetical protein [Chloroflexota bacterium]
MPPATPHIDTFWHRARDVGGRGLRLNHLLAEGARRVGGQDLDDAEFVEAEKAPFDEAPQMAMDGRIVNASCIAALFRATVVLDDGAGLRG